MKIEEKLYDSAILKSGESYFVIDALYTERLKPYRDLIGGQNWPEKLMNIAFPYADYPFTIIATPQNENGQFVFLKSFIIEYFETELSSSSKDDYLFSTDTGIIVFIKVEVLSEF